MSAGMAAAKEASKAAKREQEQAAHAKKVERKDKQWAIGAKDTSAADGAAVKSADAAARKAERAAIEAEEAKMGKSSKPKKGDTGEKKPSKADAKAKAEKVAKALAKVKAKAAGASGVEAKVAALSVEEAAPPVDVSDPEPPKGEETPTAVPAEEPVPAGMVWLSTAGMDADSVERLQMVLSNMEGAGAVVLDVEAKLAKVGSTGGFPTEVQQKSLGFLGVEDVRLPPPAAACDTRA